MWCDGVESDFAHKAVYRCYLILRVSALPFPLFLDSHAFTPLKLGMTSARNDAMATGSSISEQPTENQPRTNPPTYHNTFHPPQQDLTMEFEGQHFAQGPEELVMRRNLV
jgi:hypothetical protein